jgi:hypothetical protein
MYKLSLLLPLTALLFLNSCTSCSKEEDIEKELRHEQNISKKIQKKTIQIEKFDKKIKNELAIPSQVTSITKPSPVEEETDQTENEEIVAENLEALEASAFKTLQPKIIEETQKIPDCLENAETKEEAFACNQKLQDLNKELAMAMGDFSENKIEGYDDDFVWNEETKIKMIQEIERSTETMQEMQTCMESSITPEELDQCLKPDDYNETNERID